MNRLAILAALVALTSCESVPAEQAALRTESQILMAEPSPAVLRGAAYAETHCASCHAVGRSGESPLPAASHFRELSRRYPVADLAEAFAEGIVTSHPAMPQFVMSMRENSDLIVYLQSIQDDKSL